MRRGIESERGQASVEYVGAVLLIAALAGVALTASGAGGQAARLATAIANRFLCAVRLNADCRPPAEELRDAYGPELAALLREHAPELRFEDDEFVSLPVDPRTCRNRKCADTSRPGGLGRSFADHPATAFVHVVDCRRGPDEPDVDCSGPRRGNLYLHYWLYYPDSATRAYGRFGYHPDDWESVQVRIGPDGLVAARASSHGSYNHGADPVSDLGEKRLLGVELDARKAGWGAASGYVWVSAGSHAGRVAGGERYFRYVPGERLRLVPIGPNLDELAKLQFEPGIAPPWRKDVWRDPEHTGT